MVEEWRASRVTQLLFERLSEALVSLQETARYQPHTRVGDKVLPMTVDMCALQNAFCGGGMDILKDIINIDLEEGL